MTSPGRSHPRWQVIAGLLGGIAALTTAIVGVLAYIDSHRQPGPPPAADCLIGTWTVTSAQGTYTIGGATVQMSGVGYRTSYNNDGTVTSNNGTGYVLTGTGNGHTYQKTFTGKTTSRYKVVGKQIEYTDATAEGTWEDKVDGQVVGTGKMQSLNGAEDFTCSGNTLVTFGDHWSQTYSRTG